MLKEYDLTGRTAIVTGSGRNVGQGIALALAEAGADIVVTARTPSEIEDTARQVEALGRRALRVRGDVTDEADVQRLVDMTLNELGKIDILVNNAGGGGVPKFLAPIPGFKAADPSEAGGYTLEEWQYVIDVNLTSAFLCTRAVGPHMLARKSGKVINITSPAGTRSIRRRVAYVTAKAGLDMFTRAMAQEWARHGINVNGLGPGLVPTRNARANPELLQRMIATLPMQRACTAREVGLLAVYLASDASNFMTGQIVHVDGGQLLI